MEIIQKFLVYRNNGNGSVRYERFEVPLRPGMTMLDALFYIQDYIDSTLAFRYSCRGAICGSCGITVDKLPDLACRTQISEVKSKKKPPRLPEFHFGDHSDWDQENEILIEPLPNMPVLKDLVVDMENFWKFYEEVQPYLARDYSDIAPESKQSPEKMNVIERLVYCIACGLCWACPINSKNPKYLGPMQLAKADRFIQDSRISEKHKKEILARILEPDGVPACEKFFVCNLVCPRGVMPGTAINDIRKNFIKEKEKKIS
jgi:succinate dehydrogenase / fumarate reductase iron-sulfur subunit